jgi:REP element-mobilizing transposase RayT
MQKIAASSGCSPEGKNMDDLEIYWRRMPHWRMKGATYFVTWRLRSGLPLLVGAERDIVLASLLHFAGQRYELLAAVVMDDHVHVLATPVPSVPLKDLLRTWKGFTANKLQRVSGRLGSIWQDDSFTRIMRTKSELIEKANYISDNPSRRWPSEIAYRWVWPPARRRAADVDAGASQEI